MSKKALRIVNLIVAILVCVFALGHAFAWLAGDREDRKLGFDGSSGETYFAGGNGFKETPYLITNQYHLYNLAWLQDTGKLKDQKYYFELGKDFTVPDDLWLPPIGTDDNPFTSGFNGKGYKISNLKITTDKTKLGGGSQSVSFSNAVGMFGKTGKHPNETKGAEIKNFILEKPTVEVADTNTYSSGGNRAAGLAIGHIAENCRVSSIGVLADPTGKEAKLLMRRTGYSTFNSIIGELAKGVEFSVTGGGHISGRGGDTGQFIPDDFVSSTSKLTNVMSSSTMFKPYTWILPYNDTVENGSFAGVGLGSFSFLTGPTVNLESSGSVSDIKYYTELSGTVPTYGSGTPKEINLGTTYADKTLEAIRNKVLNGSEQITQFSHFIYWEHSPEKDKEQNTPVNVYYETNNSYVKKDGSSTQPILSNYSNIYNDGIKVNVTKDSTKIFVIASNRSEKDVRYLGVYKISDRTDDFKERVEDTSYVEGEAEISTGKYTYDKENPLQRLTLPVNKDVVACEFDLKGTGAGTYMINSTKGGINIFYLAVTGTTQGDAGSEDGKVDDTKAVSAVDFIYSDVSIAQEKENDADWNSAKVGNFIIDTSGTLYQATGTSIYFDNLDTVLEIVYLRKVATDSDPKTMQVTASVAGKVTATVKDKVAGIQP